MKFHNRLGLYTCGLLLAQMTTSWGFRAPDRPLLPPIDKRTEVKSPEAGLGVEQKTALAQLRESLPGTKVEFDNVLGSPKMITGGPGLLSGPNGTGKAISPRAAALFAGDPNGVTKAFLTTHRNLFGFGPEALDQAKVRQQYTTPHNGMRTVVWQQQVGGVEVFGAVFISHTTKNGELVTISSQFVPEPDKAAKQNPGSPVNLTPAFGVSQAVAAAAQNVGEMTKPEQVNSAGSPNGTEKRQQLRAPGLLGDTDASLVWFPMSKNELRLCWEIVLTSASRSEMFRVLVDAQTKEVLFRQCLTAYLSDITLRVYTNDSPSPFSPGWPTPNSGQPGQVQRTLLTLSGLNTNASPLGWISDGGNETLGNNVDAHTDVDANNSPDLPRPQGSPNRVFDFTLDLTQAPSTYRNAAVVQLFYWNNFMHDKTYELGFTEAAGNFQNNNFGHGGAGNDAVQADAQDGSGTDNANFNTPPDGSAGRMQMYVFNNMTPNRDGDLDAQVVLHEYTHGVSWRLVGGGMALGDNKQSDGMGEGWSDFYALCLLSDASEDYNGTFAAGAYASYLIGNPSDNQNYYFGIRRYPYCTDMTKNPLTFNDIDPSQADNCNSGAAYHTGMFGTCSGGNADEVHNEGEVWCVTLWDARANLISKYGWAVGNQLILQLVTDGMKLSPPTPNFLQARDAILQADLVNNGGANQHELWAAFAKRGMGFSATSPVHSTTSGLHESFDLPDDMRVLPQTGFVSSGPVGGPFNITSISYALTNTGTNTLTWSLSNTSSWLTASSSGGTLNPAGPGATVDISLNTVATSLPMGIYTATVSMTNNTSGAIQNRLFTLRVGQPDYYTELFAGTDNDLAYSTYTFTPDGSSSYYSICHDAASALPTDPTGGTTLNLTDDSYATANLSGGATVSVYGHSSSTFYIGSNGYLTLNSGDSAYTESTTAHFNRPRISALFHDMLPGSGSTISWKQLADRVAVTYNNLQDISQIGPNTFQIEWFFDGKISITYLGLTLRHNLTGLSAGNGVPAGFTETDLSDSGTCVPIVVSAPATATEGDGVLANAGTVTLPTVPPSDVTVTLLSSDPSEVIMPPSVIILAGQQTASFDITILDDALLDGTRAVTLSASASGIGDASRILKVYDNETATLQLTAPASVMDTQGVVQIQVDVGTPVGKDVSVTLSSDHTNKLILPPVVIIPTGQSSVSFPATIVNNQQQDPPTDVTLLAHVENWTDGSTIVSVVSAPRSAFFFAAPAPITIPDSGPAAPYPSSLTVFGLSGNLSRLTFTATNMNHTYGDDIAMLLVGPAGQKVILMANAGGSYDLVNTTITLDDAASSPLPDSAPITSGTYRPASYGTPTFPSPAPGQPYATTLSSFYGTNPNGTWRLYVYDDAGGDQGNIANGWVLSLTVTNSPPPPAPVIVSPVYAGGLMQFSFQTVPSHTYYVEYTADFANAWQPLFTIPGDGTLKTVMDGAAVNERYYRLRVQ